MRIIDDTTVQSFLHMCFLYTKTLSDCFVAIVELSNSSSETALLVLLRQTEGIVVFQVNACLCPSDGKMGVSLNIECTV